ncbi:MAG: sulfate adenylyltransferase subunit CysD [Candidatus Omnitrophota bacterium]|nr:sulfate adenylyltransferase subunit CysD [Candidatus Omnitrophota bacterium]MBU1928318.1 sulfate adenylyltransferase subunit CysD [Candidatus Omnitrophota bacterium]MBU2035526.1 sulfate adenylyltransferase subunit CysD [Candidatus Omnitrophota bacterium]MBU2257540.1 sulfate adenylyltransferase subunit CysD [Candidatus Omnitrophota bacterium]
MNHLDELENKTIFLVREAYARFRNIALLWSMGKDSTALLWIARKAFFGKIPFPVIHIDTGYKFREIYDFRNTYSKKWGIDVIISKNSTALKNKFSSKDGKFNCCNALKTEALKITLKKYGFRALLLAIRRDEHGIRAKERYFSPRDIHFNWNYQDQPAELWDFYKIRAANNEHLRIHPMLHWTELSIWKYIRREKIPTVRLYFSRGEKRYRSIGCQCCCEPVFSSANTINKIIKELETTKDAERNGRAQDKENAYNMQRLRSLGYM